MTIWQQKDVDQLPSIKDREPHTYYRLPNGEVWYPNNMFDRGESTLFVKSEEFWDKIEKELDE